MLKVLKVHKGLIQEPKVRRVHKVQRVLKELRVQVQELKVLQE